ncbi:hypothetical protein [Methylohalobius crimeensis]|uniref:hypothetical protein n=1 Tax=Methylohalobius crimeensis TaxID=244365 RepID=UPI0003B52AC6|nr:hypothetical protein [Methylohalobius crimeensis]
MKRTLSWLLSVSILWMSTWLVTDIHGVYVGARSHAHPLLIQQAAVEKDADLAKGQQEDGKDSSSHCHFCSYDHGGHVGALVMLESANPMLLGVSEAASFAYLFSWFDLTAPPRQRPPIV